MDRIMELNKMKKENVKSVELEDKEWWKYGGSSDYSEFNVTGREQFPVIIRSKRQLCI